MHHNLPLEEPNLQYVAQAQVPDGARLRTLLYVEDNPANLKLVEQIIARHPHIRLLSARDRQSRHRACARPLSRR